jgi:hypothetical protein
VQTLQAKKKRKRRSEPRDVQLEVVRNVGGRPVFLNARRFIRICRWIEQGESASEACRLALVHYTGFRRHVKRNPKYLRRLKEAEETREEFLREYHIANMLGLFDRPADEKALGALLKSPAIPGLTESLTGLRSADWQMILAKLRRGRLLAGEDPHNPGYLDTHPLVREYYGEQLRSLRTEAWKECNRRLFKHYQALAPGFNSFLRTRTVGFTGGK